MIYLMLKGGLGNMMFQIAATKSISASLGTDFSFPNLQKHLQYLSNEMEYNPKVNYCNEYLKLPFLTNANTVYPSQLTERITFPFHYEPKKINSKNVMIDGFFQSEKYFENHRNEILDFFSPTNETVDFLISKYGENLKSKTTSIHIRRGDYLKNSTHHYVQTLDYFKKGIEYLENVTDKFFIFSDDIIWCKENLKGEKFVYVENEKDYNEIYLMSLCTNNIISNSSFSWWGAWLNKNTNKIVIGPDRWFGPSLQFLKTDDILPENWIKI